MFKTLTGPMAFFDTEIGPWPPFINFMEKMSSLARNKKVKKEMERGHTYAPEKSYDKCSGKKGILIIYSQNVTTHDFKKRI